VDQIGERRPGNEGRDRRRTQSQSIVHHGVPPLEKRQTRRVAACPNQPHPKVGHNPQVVSTLTERQAIFTPDARYWIILSRTGFRSSLTARPIPGRRSIAGHPDWRLGPTGFANDAVDWRPIKWTFRRSPGRLDGPRLTSEGSLWPRKPTVQTDVVA
jgi:hypothetical protein